MPQTTTQRNNNQSTAQMKRAVIYLRVSSDQQVDRGYGDEGYSIPAQREACQRKAADLGAVVVRKYVDLAKTAKTRNRPRFMAMIADIEGDRDIDFVIVHKLNRFARNAMDDAVIDYRLGEAGAQLASVLEHIDTTPSGKLNHRIHAAFSEYENENLANEIRKGQIEKHRAGGHSLHRPGRLQAHAGRIRGTAHQLHRHRRRPLPAGAARLRPLRHRSVQRHPPARRA